MKAPAQLVVVRSSSAAPATQTLARAWKRSRRAGIYGYQLGYRLST
jgi:hypothetical protein